jgi:protocatechuate 3,4-dioxygenase alpha subunit
MPELVATPGQTIGPFFHFALPYDQDRELVPPGSPGAVRLHGYVYDGDGVGIPDAMVEIRLAGPDGVVPRVEGSMRRAGATFTGWGRSTTDPNGHYWFSTLEPGGRFVAVTVFARGLLDGLFTRAYLPGSGEDALLGSLSSEDRDRLALLREADGSLRFDVHLQGDLETPFLTFPGHGR